MYIRITSTEINTALKKQKLKFFFFFNDTATTEIYTLSLQTLFRSPSGKLTIIARPNQITEEKGGRKECPRNRRGGYSILCGRVQGGTESLCFSTGIPALPLPYG